MFPSQPSQLIPILMGYFQDVLTAVAMALVSLNNDGEPHRGPASVVSQFPRHVITYVAHQNTPN